MRYGATMEIENLAMEAELDKIDRNHLRLLRFVEQIRQLTPREKAILSALERAKQ